MTEQRAADRGVPSAAGEPPPEDTMTTYYVAFLYRGPNRSVDAKAADELQRAHLANIARLQQGGKIILAGPFLDKTDLRGLFVFKVGSMEEAQELCASDPSIQAGVLRVEIRPWYSAKGIGIFPGADAKHG